MTVQEVEAVANLGPPNARCVVTTGCETWAGLGGLCANPGVPLLSVSKIEGPELALEAFETPHPSGDGTVARGSQVFF